ncbi:hypothetical protein G7085_13880 [Tessaracoccus sp. HDW20]|nr:hypothetical protein [Tessaracoccus coleopterorum]NHB85338.1 hypothetical protein [Tessaracoccus coleopterorum]
MTLHRERFTREQLVTGSIYVPKPRRTRSPRPVTTTPEAAPTTSTP